MPQPAACRQDGAAADAEAAERLRLVREQLDATVSGLAELDYLRQRQEVLVRAALEPEREAEEQRSREEKLLEENILLLRKQLNCLRRRDAGLITQLEELDRQISDLRLDTEASHDPLETDSRPSSGFYELSDGASGSLSNSSNSVFSECFCVMVDAEGRLPSADELASCLQCDGLVGGLCDDSSSSGTVLRSLSGPHPPALDPGSFLASCDSQSKYHCDLFAQNGSSVFRYPSPLHAVAVQSPALLQVLGYGGEEGHLKSVKAGAEEVTPESCPLSAPLVSESSRWPAPCSSSSSSQTPSHKRLDSYIYSLLQRRALPIRTSRPRTSISTDPTKILRQASLCVRQLPGATSGSGLGTLRGSELKPSRPAGRASAGLQRTGDSKAEGQEVQNIGGDIMQSSLKMNPDPGSPPGQNGSSSTNKDTNTRTNSLKNKRPLPPSTGTLPKDVREPVSPKETRQPCFPPDAELLHQSAAPNSSTKPLQTGGSVPEKDSLGSSSQSQDETGGASLAVNSKYVPAQQHNARVRKGGSKTSKTTKTTKVKTSRASEHVEPGSERRGDKTYHRSSSKKSRLVEDGSIHLRVSKRAAGGGGAHGTSSSKINRLPVSIPEGRVLDKHATSTLSSVRSGVSRHCRQGNHHHRHHGRDQVVVVAKPKYKRNDYRRLRAIMEVPYDEAFRRAQRRQRQELMSHSAAAMFAPPDGQLGSPYAYVAGSDSEYSAECASLFHSTIMDTSEDERSNYTTNRFGDSESSEEEYVEESTTTSDTEESGGAGGAGGRGWRRLGAAGATGPRAEGQEMTLAQAKAFVKIKASHNLKKKILRFRSGSLKLMTTV